MFLFYRCLNLNNHILPNKLTTSKKFKPGKLCPINSILNPVVPFHLLYGLFSLGKIVWIQIKRKLIWINTVLKTTFVCLFGA